MDRFWENVIRWMAALSGIVVGWWGGWTAGSKVLVILMVMDYITGCACAPDRAFQQDRERALLEPGGRGGAS